MHTAYVSVRLGLLALLDDADMYGYQLKSEFESHTGGVWPLNIGQVYTTLGPARARRPRAQRAGEGGEPRRAPAPSTPSPPPAGGCWPSGSPASPADGPPPRDDLIAKVLLAAAGSADRALRGRDRPAHRRCSPTLQGRRRALRAASRAADAEHPDDPGVSEPTRPVARVRYSDSLARALVLDALVVRAEAELRWLDQCEARLLSRRNGGSPTRRST